MDIKTISLPVSEAIVELRTYTTVEDDEKAEAILYLGVELDQNTKPDGDSKITFPIANVIASQKIYIPRLVQSIDGDSKNIEQRIKQLRSKDYAFLREAVDEIIADNSPKAKEA